VFPTIDSHQKQNLHADLNAEPANDPPVAPQKNPLKKKVPE